MSTQGPPEHAGACALDAVDGRDRMRRWQALADLASPRASRVGGRLEVRFAPEVGAHEELAALAAAEQECCAFVTWAVTDHDDGLVLHVTAKPGSPDDVAAIAAMFDAE